MNTPPKRRNASILGRMSFGFAGVVLLTVLLMAVSNLFIQNDLIREAKEQQLRQAAENMRAAIAGLADRAATLSALVAALPQAHAALANHDREELLRLFKPVFDSLHQSYSVEEFQFHLSPAISFLRLHDPARYGDNLTEWRKTVVVSNTSGKPTAGLEMGVTGLGVRGVVPVEHEGSRIGSVEFGLSFGQPAFEEFKQRYGVDAGLYLPTEGGFTPFASTQPVEALLNEADMRRAFAGNEVLAEATLNGRSYGVLASPIVDFSGHRVGVVVVAADMQPYIAITRSALAQTLCLAALTLALGILTAWLMCRTIASPIRRMTATMLRLAGNDLTAGISDLDRDDEIGRMARSVEVFRDAMLAMCRLQEQHIANLKDRERLITLADTGFEGVLITIDGKVVEGNKRSETLLGAPISDIFGRPFVDFVTEDYRDQVFEHALDPSCDAHEFTLLRPSGEEVPVEMRSRLTEYYGRAARLYAFHDISEQKRADARIRFLAHHDAMTGLPNRVRFLERLSRSLDCARQRNEHLAVLFLDLDHFKDVNDLLGHAAGDQLLASVAERLTESVRSRDMIARLGGDEFAIVFNNLSDNDAAAAAQRIIDLLAVPFDLTGQEAVIGCTIGIACDPNGSVGAEELLRNADIALYQAKAERRGTFRFFEEKMNTRLKARKAIEHDLRRAIAADQLVLYYQPQVDLRDGRTIGVEALLRWQDPKRGWISPGEFIPVAEETGLIVPLGAWVLRTACAQAMAWPGLAVAVNLSPVQFLQPGLEELVARTLAETGLEPSLLELEITERILLRDTETTLATLQALRALGVRIAMDDFGTGYSSLSYLRRFPFDKIKIDRSFIGDLEQGADAAAIVCAVLGLGRSLGIRTIAEGIETAGQRERLIAEGCEEGQGFLFSRPIPAEAVPSFLLQQVAA